MQTKSDSLQVFTDRLNALVNCHLLLASKAISTLLKCIASTPEFTAVVGQTLERISYVEEFDRSRVFYFKEGKTHLKFVLPNDKHRAFTLVVCLLSEMDSGRRDLLQFLHEYYPTPDNDDFLAFQRFAQNVLIPFGKAGESILNVNSSTAFGGVVARQADTTATTSVGVQVASSAPIRSESPVDVFKSICKELETFCFKIENDAYISLIQKNECISLANALRDAILDKNENLIRQLWIGFNNTLIVNNVNNDSCAKIQSLLAQANLC